MVIACARRAGSTRRRVRWLRRAGCVAVVLVSSVVAVIVPAAAQTEQPFGLPHRAYEGLLQGEAVDTASGTLSLRHTDLVLPGDGWELRFERMFNGSAGLWRFGLGGLPLRVLVVDEEPNPPMALFETLDGQVQGNVIAWDTFSVFMTDRFWRYHQATNTLAFPDGRRAVFASGRLSQVFDAAGTLILSLVWQTNQVTVTQHLSHSATRQVVLAGPGMLNLGLYNTMPTSMTYAGRTWQYAVTPTSTEITPPVGPSWTFAWSKAAAPWTGWLQALSVTLPTGGRVDYAFGVTQGQTMQHYTLQTRQMFDEGSQLLGEWTYAYDFVDQEVPYYSQQTTVTGPTVTTTYDYDDVVLTGSVGNLWRRTALVGRTVTAGAVTLEAETLTYVSLTTLVGSSKLPGLASRTITRDGVTHTTTFTYNPYGSNYHDFHNPSQIVESSGGVSRTATLTYSHSYNGPHSWPYYVALPAGRQVTENGDTTTVAWGYDANVFRTSETVNGLTTTFTPDAYLNVQTVTRPNGKTTSFAYSYGQVSEITTSEPGYGLTRVINPDGTVQSETQAGRTTSYSYDALTRLTGIQGPGGPAVSAPVVIAYNNTTGRTITTTRGSSSLVETLDGFGRVRETVDGLGIRTRTAFDALGRVVYQSYPFQPGVGAGDVGTTFQYDGLSRVTRETHPDGTFVEYVYAGNTVTVRDELHTAQTPRQTVYTYQAFGHPDDARLVQLRDANNQIWSYAYTVDGAIKTLSGPNSVVRSWNYTHPNKLLASETLPESGTVTYSYLHGVPTQRVDARGTTFSYVRDGNDRVTQITAGGQVTTFTYEAGSDVLETMAVGGVTTTFGLDAAGRMASRTDVVDGKTFVTGYEYNVMDALLAITYPSGRRVRLEYDAELRVTRVSDDSGTEYATGFTYHPSGALTGYTAGNGLQTVVSYDDERYWVNAIRVGQQPSLFELTYDYVPTANVERIVDVHTGAQQVFGFDKLHRLTSVTGTGGYPSASFTFDAHGRRTGSGYSYHSGQPFRLKTINGFGNLMYDNNGNLTHHSGGAFQYTYGPDNRLTRATAGGVTTDFAYDADAWRVKAAVTGGTTTYFLRGPGGELLTEWINTSPVATVRDYVYGGGRLLAVVTTPGETK